MNCLARLYSGKNRLSRVRPGSGSITQKAKEWGLSSAAKEKLREWLDRLAEALPEKPGSLAPVPVPVPANPKMRRSKHL